MLVEIKDMSGGDHNINTQWKKAKNYCNQCNFSTAQARTLKNHTITAVSDNTGSLGGPRSLTRRHRWSARGWGAGLSKSVIIFMPVVTYIVPHVSHTYCHMFTYCSSEMQRCIVTHDMYITQILTKR